MKVLSVIPARGGSKGIPKKNIVKINDKPLIEFTIEAALAVKNLTDIVVSTDDEEIADIAIKLGAQVPFMRPKELSNDVAESAPVIQHAINFMENQVGFKYDAVLMLQPTSPFRKSSHIQKALDVFIASDYDSVVSVVNVDGYHPFRMKRLVDNKLINFIDQGFWDMRPRQNLPKVYIRNGSIYLCSRDVIINDGVLIGKNCYGMEMNEFDSINIDSKVDLIVAEAILREGLID
jgi:CMP-N,N'-diacetyllegionaminic acid synthase